MDKKTTYDPKIHGRHAFRIMPDHLHGIIQIRASSVANVQPCTNRQADVGAWRAMPLPATDIRVVPRGSIGSIAGLFKSESTKTVNRIRNVMGVRIWQRNYLEHIIRDEEESRYYRMYIRDNPGNWKSKIFAALIYISKQRPNRQAGPWINLPLCLPVMPACTSRDNGRTTIP
jgi:REP element-mobilizing transposase RayT